MTIFSVKTIGREGQEQFIRSVEIETSEGTFSISVSSCSEGLTIAGPRTISISPLAPNAIGLRTEKA